MASGRQWDLGYQQRGQVVRVVILPIWHNVSHNDVMNHSPSLATKVARSTAEFSVEQIAAEIAQLDRR